MKTYMNLASLRFIKLNLEYQNTKIRTITNEDIFFSSFMKICSKSTSYNQITHLLLSCSPYKKADIIIAIHGKKNTAFAVKQSCIF